MGSCDSIDVFRSLPQQLLQRQLSVDVNDGSRLTLFYGRVTVRAPDGESHRRNLETPEAFAAVLHEEFAFAVSDTDLRRMLRVMEQRGTRGAPHPFFA
jgi:arylamine N-acetyltransferase